MASRRTSWTPASRGTGAARLRFCRRSPASPLRAAARRRGRLRRTRGRRNSGLRTRAARAPTSLRADSAQRPGLYGLCVRHGSRLIPTWTPARRIDRGTRSLARCSRTRRWLRSTFITRQISSLSRSSKKSQRSRSWSFGGRSASASRTRLAVLGAEQHGVHRRACFSGASYSSSKRGGSRADAVLLEEHVVADTVDERAQAFGRVEPALLLEGLQHPGKGFLPDVLDGRGRAEARAQLQRQELAKVLSEMAFGVGVGRMRDAGCSPWSNSSRLRMASIAIIVGQFSISRVVVIHRHSLQSGRLVQLCP